jgi:hypothetical protein
MAIRLFRRKSDLEERNLLELTPYRFYKEETDADGNFIVLIPKFKNKYLVKYLAPKLKSEFFRVQLDKFGSSVWGMLNGENSVKFIAEELVKKHGDEIQPIYDRLPKFIMMLHTNKLISFKEIESKGV